MPVVRCPIEDCKYQTPDVDPMVVAALITTHATVHASSHLATPMAKAEKVKRPVYHLPEQWRTGITSYLDGAIT